jgi:hypothetical protein
MVTFTPTRSVFLPDDDDDDDGDCGEDEKATEAAGSTYHFLAGDARYALLAVAAHTTQIRT